MSIFRYLILLLPIAFFSSALFYDLDPAGSRTAEYNFNADSAMISKLFPADRLQGADSTGQLILKEPVYFKVRYPQDYDKAIVEMTYENQGQDLLQVGLKQFGEEDWNYSLQPVANSSLDDLDWPKVSSGNITLWQRVKKFASVNEFLESYYELNVAAYNFDLLKKYILPGYQPAKDRTEISKMIRGDYSIYTYVKSEDLDWQFKFVDFNRTEGPEEIPIKVSDWSGKEIFSETLPDDGSVSNVSGASSARTYNLKLADLAEGVYRIDWSVESDIFTTDISTKQHLFGFIDRLYLVNNKEYTDGLPDLNLDPTTVYTNIGTVSLYTSHPMGLQTVMVDGKQVVIDKTHEQFFASTAEGLSTVYSPLNDILIRGDGLIFFDKSQFFNPEVIKLKDFDSTMDVDYVIAGYKSPQINQDGSYSISVPFDLTDAGLDEHSLRFIISAPNLVDRGNQLKIKKIKVTLLKPPLQSWQDIYDVLKNKIEHAF